MRASAGGPAGQIGVRVRAIVLASRSIHTTCPSKWQVVGRSPGGDQDGIEVSLSKAETRLG